MPEVGVIPADSRILVASNVEWRSVIGGADAVRALESPVASPRKTGKVRGARLSWS